MTLDTRFVRGADKLQQRIATIRQTLDLPTMRNEIVELLYQRTMRRFDRQVTPDEEPWAPLSPEGARSKRQGGYESMPLLQRTRKLRSSIRVIRGGIGSTFINTGAGGRIGIDDPRMAVIGRALGLGTKHTPARRFLGIGALDIKAVDGLLRRKARKLETL